MNPTPISEEARKAAFDIAVQVNLATNSLTKASDYDARIQSAIDQGCAAKEAECERLNMQLVACMTATIQNTETTIEDRIGPDNPCWSQAYADVCRGVDREMALRAQLSELEKDKRRIETLQAAADAVKEASGNVTYLKLTIPDGNTVRDTLDSLGAAQQGREITTINKRLDNEQAN